MTRHHEVITVATSNDSDAIDTAAMRAGRFDVTLQIGPPDETARREILRHFLEKIAIAGPIDYDRIARSTDGATGADLREVIRRSFLATDGSGITTESLVETVENLNFASVSDESALSPHSSDVGRYL
ncbi:MAG: ATP-binding protein [Microthrixaceae bacterium]